MSLCVVTGHQCCCQPEEGIPCPGVQQLRADLHRIRNQSLEWALACPHNCEACDAMYEVIKGSHSQPNPYALNPYALEPIVVVHDYSRQLPRSPDDNTKTTEPK